MARSVRFAASVALALLSVVPLAHAQQAPIGGSGGGANRDGSAGGDAVTFNLPAERHALPVPVALTFGGGTEVGVGGVGWSVGLSSISQNNTFSRQRPRALVAGGAPQLFAADDPTRGRASLTLLGANFVLVPAANGTWRSLVGGALIEAVKSNDVWTVTDGSGRRYRFEKLAGLGDPGRWYLTEIRSGHDAQSKVVLQYTVQSVEAGGITAPELTLDSIRYNFDATGSCAKNEVKLAYGNAPELPAGALLGVEVDQGILQVRTRLLTGAQINARGTSCATAAKTLSRYELVYAPDVDTRQPRLVAVNTFGAAGTPEGAVALPLGRYRYGRVSSYGLGGKGATTEAQFVYGERTPRALPPGQVDLGRTMGSPTTGFRYATKSMLLDLDGDGLLDYVTSSDWFQNRGDLFLSPMSMFSGLPTMPDALSAQSTRAPLYQYPRSPSDNGAGFEETWITVIDMNHDGRPDVIDSFSTPGYWRLYLNRPDGWQVFNMDMSLVNGRLRPRLGVASGMLPSTRSVTGTPGILHRCFTSTDETNWIPCPNVKTSFEVRPQISRVEWQLRDVNGDGYPDFVVNSLRTNLRKTGDECTGLLATRPGHIEPGGGIFCDDTWDVLYIPDQDEKQNHLMVFLNTAGARLGAQSPFADWIPLTSEPSCSVEEYVGTADQVSLQDAEGEDDIRIWGAVKMRGSRQECGFVELNGDGVVDRLESKGQGGPALLGTGIGYVPAPELVTIGGAVLTESATDYYAKCRDPQHPAPAGQEFTTRGVRGLLDVNGDGIADYWDGTHVSLGTGAGFAAPIEIATTLPSTDPGIALSETTTNCDGTRMRTTGGLFDLDGDGRLDYLRVAGQSLRIFSVLEPTGLWGALAAGRITERENGYGRTDHFRYESLKGRQLPDHQIPSPEIVLTETWTTHNGGATAPDVDPTRYGYLGAHLWFDSLADRWRFYGYDRIVALQGRDDDGDGSFSGIAILSDAYRPGDAIAGVWENQYLGQPRRTTTLSGWLTFNPNSYAADATLYPEWRSQTDWSYGAAIEQLPGFVNPTDDCLSAPQPMPPMTFASSDGDLDPPCRARVDVYDRVSQSRDGKGAPSADHYVETRDAVVEVDAYSRPTMIYHYGDTHRDDDDWCEKRAYAVPQTVDRVLDRTASVQRLVPVVRESCIGAVVVLAGAHTRFDNLPEGQVGLGLSTHSSVERRDPATGALLDQFTTQQIAYDGRGNPATFWRENGSGLAQTTTVSGYDAFGLRATAFESRATGSSSVFQTRLEYDPYTLVKAATTNAKGVTERSQYDGYGRLLRITRVDPRDGSETVESLGQYFGATIVGPAPLHASEPSTDIVDPIGTRFRIRGFADRTLVSAVDPNATTPGRNESWRTNYYDYLGHKRYTELQLGDDYAGQSLIVEERTHDSRGLVTFEAAPYVAGAPAPHYGTAYLHAPSGEVTCRVLATQQPFVFPTTSVANGTFASCSDERFEQFQRVTVGSSPDDLDPTSTSWGAYSETTVDALGRAQRHRRMLGTTVLERTDYQYDRLGQPRLTRRYADAAATQAVDWISDHDSLGWRMRFSEPGTATRSQTFNRAGLVTEMWWMDGADRKAVRTRYDGFGRPTYSVEAKNGVEDAASAASYVYDRSSGEAFHRDTEYALGELTFATNAAQRYYAGYNPFGQSTFEAWVDSAGRRVEYTNTYRSNGQPVEKHWRMPDSVTDELARFEYDTAQRLRVVTWFDESSASGRELFRATTIDPFGRLRAARHGNGVTSQANYRDAQRDELLGYGLTSPSSGSIGASFAYDGDGRLASRSDVVSSTARNETTTYRYDAASRLSSMATLSAASVALQREAYTYDGLGNLLRLDDQVGTRSFTATPDTVDRDRLCSVSGPGFPFIKGCLFGYDALGAVTTGPLGTNGAFRTTTYDGRGRTKSMTAQLTTATWQYGPLGGVATSSMSGVENRTSVSYGGGAEWNESSVAQGRFDRLISAGDVVVKKEGTGPNAAFLYSHAEQRGTRAVFDRSGKLVHELDYRPFGGTRIDTAVPGAATYETAQWNGGEAFGPLAVNQLGARMYEPRLGRFLSRDPLVLDGSSSKSHPYAFAYNDPINRTDASGMRPPCAEWDCIANGSIASLAALIIGNGISYALDAIESNSRPPDEFMPLDQYPNLDELERRVKWTQQVKAWHTRGGKRSEAGEFLMHLTPPGAQRFYLIPPSEMLIHRACAPGHGADCLEAQDLYWGARASYGFKPWADFTGAWRDVVFAMLGDTSSVAQHFIPGGDHGPSWLPPRTPGALGKWLVDREVRKIEEEQAEDLEKRLEKEFEAAQSCTNGSCFVGSTLVHTEQGPRPISSIDVGDWVWAEDPETAETTLRQVLHTSIRFDELVWDVELDDGNGNTETLRVTGEHPFWTRRGWVRVDHLTASDEIEHRAGWWTRVADAHQTATRAVVYNLVVDGLHTYFVGETAVLVHNGCPCPQLADPNSIRFSQDSISSRFRNGEPVDEAIAGLEAKRLTADDFPPIRVFEKDGVVYTLDNRRLYAFQEAGVPIRTVPATAAELTRELADKLTTENGGVSVRVRGR